MTIKQQLHTSKTHQQGNDPSCPVCIDQKHSWTTVPGRELNAWCQRVRVHDIEAWKRGEYVPSYLLSNDVTLLRIEGQELVTSRGARVPIDHARRALVLVQAVKARGEVWQRNGHTIRLGHYQIDRVDVDGTITAGCHVVPWSEVERIAPQLQEGV